MYINLGAKCLILYFFINGKASSDEKEKSGGKKEGHFCKIRSKWDQGSLHLPRTKRKIA